MQSVGRPFRLRSPLWQRVGHWGVASRQKEASAAIFAARGVSNSKQEPRRAHERKRQQPADGSKHALRAGSILELTCTGLAFGGEGICRLSGADSDSLVVFVDRALPGERLAAQVTQAKKRYARAAKLASLSPHDCAAPPTCPHFGPCGGCTLQTLAYDAQLQAKQRQVADLLQRTAGLPAGEVAAVLRPIVSAPPGQQLGYRNKMEFSAGSAAAAAAAGVDTQQPSQEAPVARSAGSRDASGSGGRGIRQQRGTPGAGLVDSGSSSGGGLTLGLHRPGSTSQILPIQTCSLQPDGANALLQRLQRLCAQLGLQAYDPRTGTGLLQDIVIRRGSPGGGSGGSSSSSNTRGRNSGEEYLVNITTAADGRQALAALAAALMQPEATALAAAPSAAASSSSSSSRDGSGGTPGEALPLPPAPAVVGVVNSVSQRGRPAGERRLAAEHVLAGRGYLRERLCGLEFEVSANSFFQTNTQQAEALYRLVAEAAELRPSDTLLDLYCGAGSIGLCLAALSPCRQLFGVEVAAAAVADARRNAERNRVSNATFLEGDLERLQLQGRLPAPDVVVVDPARPGLSPLVVDYLRVCGARRVVYVSCNASTQARDIRALCAPAASTGGAASVDVGSVDGVDSADASSPSSSGPFRLVSVQAVDLYPQTWHVETVAVLDAMDMVRACCEALQPAVSMLEPYVRRLEPLARAAVAAVEPRARAAAAWADQHAAALSPWQLVLLTIAATLLAVRVLQALRRVAITVKDKGWRQLVAGFVLDLPLLRGRVAREQAALAEKIREDLRKKAAGAGVPPALRQLPKTGAAANDVKRQLKYKEGEDMRFADGDSKVSGTVYMAGAVHKQLLNEVYAMFSLTNPMHSDVFPSVRKMEGEVVAMTAGMLGGGPGGDPGVCGSMTSGGTESILTAVKASRDYMAATRGIAEPEMVIAVSAHAAFVKAAEYFKIRLIRLPVGRDYRLSTRAVRAAISPRTVLVVASAVGFPHGVMDHVEDIAQVTQRAGVPLHVDCCLGGFVLPFAARLGYRVPRFDFSVPGVTSISVDTHKFGMAHKGTSVVLYRNKDIRRHQYTSITDWTGGLYISPGFAGSRSGALIATAWASMVHLGEDGYMKATDAMMKAAAQFVEGVRGIEGIEVVGEPEMTVVAFKASASKLDIYKVNDLLAARGWHLNALQHPPALHICLTAAHSPAMVDLLLRDLNEAVAAALQDPKAGASGNAPLYGMAATVPDRRIVSTFLAAYQDALLEAM